MGLIHRYIFKQIAIPTLLAAAAISLLLVGGGVQEQINLLQARTPIAQLNMLDVGRISAFILPTLLGFIFPITYLLGILLTFSRLADHSELIAMKAAGIPLKRIALPVVFVGAMLSGGVFIVQDQIQPWAWRNLSQLVASDLPMRIGLDMLPTGVMHKYGDWHVFIGERDENNALRDIVILNPGENGEADAYYADSAHVEHGADGSWLVLEEGYIVPADMNTKVAFPTMRERIPSLQPQAPLTARYGKTLSTLLVAEKKNNTLFMQTGAISAYTELRKVRIEIAERFAFPLMCLAVSIIAAPIGARSRKSGRAFTFLSGLIIIGGYFILRKSVEPEPLLGLYANIGLAQIPNLVLVVAGLFFFWRVDRI